MFSCVTQDQFKHSSWLTTCHLQNSQKYLLNLSWVTWWKKKQTDLFNISVFASVVLCNSYCESYTAYQHEWLLVLILQPVVTDHKSLVLFDVLNQSLCWIVVYFMRPGTELHGIAFLWIRLKHRTQQSRECSDISPWQHECGAAVLVQASTHPGTHTHTAERPINYLQA